MATEALNNVRKATKYRKTQGHVTHYKGKNMYIFGHKKCSASIGGLVAANLKILNLKGCSSDILF